MVTIGSHLYGAPICSICDRAPVAAVKGRPDLLAIIIIVVIISESLSIIRNNVGESVALHEGRRAGSTLCLRFGSSSSSAGASGSGTSSRARNIKLGTQTEVPIDFDDHPLANILANIIITCTHNIFAGQFRV